MLIPVNLDQTSSGKPSNHLQEPPHNLTTKVYPSKEIQQMILKNLLNLLMLNILQSQATINQTKNTKIL